MNIAVFSTKPYDREFLEAANVGSGQRLTFLEPRLTAETASLAVGHDAVCAFVQDVLDRSVLERLASSGTRLIALRCAGFNNVDIEAAKSLGLCVVRVPAYSPHAVAEHAVAMMLTLNRKVHRAFARVREGNFSLNGLLGFDMYGRTAGLVGVGQIGAALAHILHGFGCRVLAYDLRPNAELEKIGVRFCSLAELYAESEIISLHAPLTPQTHHLINAESLSKMKTGVMLINTSRGAVIDTVAVIEALKSGKIGYLGLDVYEDEADLFFEDRSARVLQDDVLARLLSFTNVIVTGHQAFFTREALERIASTTFENIRGFERGEPCGNRV